MVISNGLKLASMMISSKSLCANTRLQIGGEDNGLVGNMHSH